MQFTVTTNQKPTTDIQTKKRERKPNIALKVVIISQGKRTKEDGRSKKEL